jgi:hypothetical protein
MRAKMLSPPPLNDVATNQLMEPNATKESGPHAGKAVRPALLLWLGAATVAVAATIAFLRLHLSLLMQGILGAVSLIGFVAVLFGILDMVLTTIENAVGEGGVDDPVESRKNRPRI